MALSLAPTNSAQAGLSKVMNIMDHKRVILHVDMDAFFASVEQRDNPLYRGKPVIVGAEPGRRGVVSAASYEARQFGIHSAMPINEAYRRCPKGIFVRPRGGAYSEESRRIMRILESFSPQIEQVSVDEAFLDVSGTGKLWGSPLEVAQRVAARIRQECHLTASIGIAPNKFLAKIASDFQKPEGITEVPFEPDRILQWLAPLNIGCVWGIGSKSREQLHRMGIRTIGDLQNLSKDVLVERFGKAGLHFFQLSRGLDDRPVAPGEPVKSISREYTFDTDCADRDRWNQVLLGLSRDVAYRARKKGLLGSTIVATYRLSDFSRHSKRCSLSKPTDLAVELFQRSSAMLGASIPHGCPLRLIGVGLTNFERHQQIDLFGNPQKTENWRASETAMDQIADRFGKGTIVFAREKDNPDDPR